MKPNVYPEDPERLPMIASDSTCTLKKKIESEIPTLKCDKTQIRVWILEVSSGITHRPTDTRNTKQYDSYF